MSAPPVTPQYLSRRDAAAYLGMSYKWMGQGAVGVIPYYRFGANAMYKVSDLDHWARQQRVGR